MGDDICKSQIWPIASLPGKISIDTGNIPVFDDMENLATFFMCQVKTRSSWGGRLLYELKTKK